MDFDRVLAELERDELLTGRTVNRPVVDAPPSTVEEKAVKKERQRAYDKSVSRPADEPDLAVWGKTPASEYKTVYGELEPVGYDKSRWEERIFANASSAHNKPLVKIEPIQIITGVTSFNPKLHDFMRLLVEDCNRELPVDLDDEKMFTTTGIHSDFNKLLCIAGYAQTPMSYTAVDNAAYRKSLGLEAHYTPVGRRIALNVWRLIARQAKVVKVNVPKKSTGGMRRFSTVTQLKLDFALYLLTPSNLEKWLAAVEADDFETLANVYETVFATYIQRRGQVDSITKMRRVFSLTYALFGDASGEPEMFADKSIDAALMGTTGDYSDFAAVRQRVVHAGPWAINCVLQCCATTMMHAMFDKYPGTFHVNTAAEIVEQVEGWHVLCSDVTEYDRSMSEDAIYVAHEMLQEYWDPRLIKASWRLFNAPYFSKPLDIQRGDEKLYGRWVGGSPGSADSRVMAGNRSGHAFTSLIGKVNKVIDTLIVINHKYPVEGREEEYLLGKGPFKIIDNGDDEIVCSHTAEDMNWFKKARADLSKGHYLVEPEVGQGFSGLLLCRKGVTSYDPKPRVHSTLEKLLVPERSIGGVMRPYWPIGMVERINALSTTDAGRVAWDIFKTHWRNVMLPDHGDFITLVNAGMASMKVATAGLTAQDKEVLEQPEKLHYKYTAGEIAPSVLNLVTSGIPVEVVEQFLKDRYYGTLV